jgi:hypothetical protein
MFFQDGSPSGNHGILVNHHPCVSCLFAVDLRSQDFGRDVISRTEDGNLNQQQLLILDDSALELPVTGLVSEFRLFLSHPGTVKLLLWRRTVAENQFQLVSVVDFIDGGGVGGGVTGARSFRTSAGSVPYDTRAGDLLGLWLEDGAGVPYDGAALEACPTGGGAKRGRGLVYRLRNMQPDDLILGKTYTAAALSGSGSMPCRNYSIEATIIQRECWGLFH